ncbi:MAG: hypothetical protein IJW36_03460 [Clostridia bacterium]|nr:hypothetical protein [Clostridia bacterium]
MEDKDFSKEFVQFQLKTSGLLYAAALRIKCAEEKERIKQEHETRRKRLNRKISMLTNRLATNDENEKKEIREITKLEKLADIEEIEQ